MRRSWRRFWCSYTISRRDIGSSTTTITIVVFSLTLLIDGAPGTVLRDESIDTRATRRRLVEERYASLIANASDVIMVVAADGALRFASPPPSVPWA